jgi:hypothetical protein
MRRKNTNNSKLAFVTRASIYFQCLVPQPHTEKYLEAQIEPVENYLDPKKRNSRDSRGGSRLRGNTPLEIKNQKTDAGLYIFPMFGTPAPYREVFRGPNRAPVGNASAQKGNRGEGRGADGKLKAPQKHIQDDRR